MSTNISEIMFELEGYGVPKEVVARTSLALIVAGQRTVIAARTEEALRRMVGNGGDALKLATQMKEVRSVEERR